MRPTVHLRPDRLRTHAAAAVELSGTLQAALSRQPSQETGAARQLTDLHTSLRRAARELAELGAVLAAVAVAAESADRDAARAVHAAGPS